MLELEEAILWEGRDGYGADLMQGPLLSAIGSLFPTTEQKLCVALTGRTKANDVILQGTIHIKSKRPGWKGGGREGHSTMVRIRKGSLATNQGTAQECGSEPAALQAAFTSALRTVQL